MSLFRRSTPLEKHALGKEEVWVKRDDLFARPPAPPLGKLRGARHLLGKLHRRGVRLVGCWDTRISALGQGIAICARDLRGMRVIAAYPAIPGQPIPEALRVAGLLGAEILPVRAGRITISFAEARRYVEARGGVMLPFGLDCVESVAAVLREARRIPDEAILGGTAVVSCGSGVTLAGLIQGLGSRPSRYVGVSSGRSVRMIESCLRKYVKIPTHLRIIPANYPYTKELTILCPFPSHPNYDLKAWDYLRRNLRRLPKPILFWNVGALTTGATVLTSKT
jgi:1-aminocyclopropane-1-carboxylate deaminase/D-cysteine desulfhydrase-like pyridoxal-dependent ACC family enzyme